MKRLIIPISNWFPPQEDKEKVRKSPLKAIKKIEFFFLCEIMPFDNNVRKIKLRNNPSGSDLNQPIDPLTKIGIEIENSKDESKPAVVPEIVLTKKNMTTDVREPKITGKTIT